MGDAGREHSHSTPCPPWRPAKVAGNFGMVHDGADDASLDDHDLVPPASPQRHGAPPAARCSRSAGDRGLLADQAEARPAGDLPHRQAQGVVALRSRVRRACRATIDLIRARSSGPRIRRTDMASWMLSTAATSTSSIVIRGCEQAATGDLEDPRLDAAVEQQVAA